jgi:hypothetical protein
MASQVLSGNNNVSYTNNTGQNVRIVINYMASSSNTISMSWAGASAGANYVTAIGRNLAFSSGKSYSGGTNQGAGVAIAANNALVSESNEDYNFALPTELMLSAGQTFSASCGAYNIVVIPEAG